MSASVGFAVGLTPPLQVSVSYFVFPSEGDGVGPRSLAQDIVRYYFVEGSDEPQPIPPDPRIPNEIRILDEAGNIVDKWSLDDECAQRRKDKHLKLVARDP